MLKGNWIIVACILAALLPSAGCQTSDNPAEGGIVGGLHGLMSGSYDQRLRAQQAQLGNARLEGQYLDSNNARLETEADQAATQRAKLRRELVSLEARTRELTSETNQIQADTETRRRQRADLEGRLGRVRAELAQLGRDVDASRKSAEAAEHERRALEDEVQDLTVVANALR